MKKTLITLLALANFSFGAEYVPEVVWTADFGNEYLNADNTVKGYTTTLTSAGTFWDASKLAVDGGMQTSSSGRLHMEGGTYGDWSSDFQFTTTLTLTGDSITAGHISELKASASSDWLCLGVSSVGALTLSGNSITVGSATGTVSLGTEYVITLTKIGSNLTLSAGDASVTATLNSTGGVSDYSGVINNITVGGNTGEGNRVPAFVKEITYSTMKLVPEPTTATLSLLALAGLAARRRRK